MIDKNGRYGMTVGNALWCAPEAGWRRRVTGIFREIVMLVELTWGEKMGECRVDSGRGRSAHNRYFPACHAPHSRRKESDNGGFGSIPKTNGFRCR